MDYSSGRVSDLEQFVQSDRAVLIDGAYRLTRLISRGSMGTVFEAVQLRLNRRVAVKIMVAELTENPKRWPASGARSRSLPSSPTPTWSSCWTTAPPPRASPTW